VIQTIVSKFSFFDKRLIILSIFILFQVLYSILIGLEIIPALIILTAFLILLIGLFYPEYLIFSTLILTLGIEGKLIENFVLFRFLGFNWYLMDIFFITILLFFLIRFDLILYNFRIDRFLLIILLFQIYSLYSSYRGLQAGYELQAIFYDYRSFFYYLFFFFTFLLIDEKKKVIQFTQVLLAIVVLKCIVDSYLSLFVFSPTFNVETREMLNFARLLGYNEIVYMFSFIGFFILFFFTKNNVNRIFYLLLLMFSFLALYLSYTRGSWLSTIVSLFIGVILIVFYNSSIINLRNIVIALFTILTSVLLFNLIGIINLEILIKRISSFSISKIDISNLGRLIEYASAIEAFLQNPLFGVGLGYFFVYFAPGIGPIASIYCHNSYLYILSKMGLIGLILFLSLIIYILLPIIKVAKRFYSDEFYQYSFIFLLIFLSVVIKSFTTWHLNTVTIAPFIGMSFGVSLTIRKCLYEDEGRA
jgi:O-antigen ligase